MASTDSANSNTSIDLNVGRTSCPCSICLNSRNTDPIVKLECSHLFHQSCIDGWILKGPHNMYTCPLCRTEHEKYECEHCSKYVYTENKPYNCCHSYHPECVYGKTCPKCSKCTKFTISTEYDNFGEVDTKTSQCVKNSSITTLREPNPETVVSDEPTNGDVQNILKSPIQFPVPKKSSSDVEPQNLGLCHKCCTFDCQRTCTYLCFSCVFCYVYCCEDCCNENEN